MSYLKKIEDYSLQVVNGEITACQKHIWACQRFLSDVEKYRNDKDYPFYFDEKRAEQFSDWAKLFKHRKGVLAGKYIELSDIAHFCFGNIYGWYEKDTGYRRFNKLYWQVSRKNAKSQYLSLVATYELFVFPGDEVAEVYSAATKKDQSRIIYDECVKMLDNCEDIISETHYKESYGRLVRLSNGAFMRPLSEEDRKTGDGLNPQCGIIDEYHAHETSEIYDILDSGMGARPQPLMAIITTAGFNLNNPCYRVEYDLVSKILNPNLSTNLDSYFCMVNELDRNETGEAIKIGNREIKPGELIDDIKDPNVWVKSNPIICSYPEGIKYLEKKLKEALEAPEKMRNFLTKHMNVWVNLRGLGFMDTGKWTMSSFKNYCEHEKIEDLINEKTDKKCWVGCDLSAKIDLTSVNFEFKDEKGNYYIKSHSFMPSERFASAISQDKVPYDLWERDGWLTVIDGAVIDYTAIVDYIVSVSDLNGWYVEEVCIDPWGAAQITSSLDNLGFNVVNIIQGYKTLSEPTKNFREQVYNKKMIHDGSPVLSFAVGNAITRQDYNQNLMLDKSKAKQRIDPLASCINSHCRCMVADVNTSLYNKRGLREL